MPGTGWAQAAAGAPLFRERCASCHNGSAESRAPSLDALRARTPQAVLEALVTGSMRPQGARLSGPERRAVAEFVTAKPLAGDVRGAARGHCEASGAVPGGTPLTTPPAPSRRGAPSGPPDSQSTPREPAWNGWSPTPRNTRFQTGQQAGLVADEMPRLALTWAFGFPDASVSWAQPSIAGGRLYVGSQNGTVYAIDARRGCIHWTFSAAGGVRTAMTIADGRVFFGDTSGNAHAVDAATGAALWVRRVDDHPLARITGSPVSFDGRLYVPVSSYEESQGADPSYPCCTFRGSVVALDAASGRIIWQTYLMPEPGRRGTSSAGVPLWGPSGAAVWSAPTIDPVRRRLYVATGNAYSGPSAALSNAVVALDLDRGHLRWSRQFTEADVYLTGCRAGNPNCPETNGPDLDFGSPPMLVTVDERDLLVIGQKSGWAYAMSAEDGREVWRYRAGQGGVLGGVEWGAAVDGTNAYFAVSDITTPQPGGLHAVSLRTGERAWFAAPQALTCAGGRGCSAAQPAPITVIPGVVLSGATDGSIRAHSTSDGTIVWTFDTNREFTTVNGVPARGASIGSAGPVVAGGMVYVSSGYGAFGGRPGNVLLAFAVE